MCGCMRERAESSNFTSSENSELSGPYIKCFVDPWWSCGKSPNITTTWSNVHILRAMSAVELYWTRLCSENWNQIFVANMLLDCDKGASEIVLHKKWQRRRSCQEASPHTLRCCTHRLTSQQLGCQSGSSSSEWISRDLMILWYTMNLNSQSQFTSTRTKNAFPCFRAAAIQMTKGADRMLLCPPRRHVALTSQQANKIA